MKKRQRSAIPAEIESISKPSKRQKKIILNTDNLTSPSSTADHSAKGDDRYNTNHKHTHKHSHSYSSHSSYSGHTSSSHSSENENDDSSNGEKKEKIIIQIKNTNVKKKKEKFIIQIKNDKRKKGTSPNSATVNSEIQNDFDSNKKQSSPKKEKKILVLSPDKEKSKKEKKNNEDNKNDNGKEITGKNKKKHSENKKDISVESKKEAILKIINNSATSNNPESQEGKKKNDSTSKQHNKKNIEDNEILLSPIKKGSLNKDNDIENEKPKPRGRPPKSIKKKMKKESIDSKTMNESKDESKTTEVYETEQSITTEQKETPSNIDSISSIDKSDNIPQDKEIKIESETEAKKHRGRPKKGRNSNITHHHHINPRSHLALAQRRHEEEEMTEEMILEEEISDPKGDEKVDIDGVLKDGRKYNVRTFILPHRSPTRIYMFTLDAAKQIGYKDSYLFLTKYPGVRRLWTNQDDRNYLCDNGIMNNLLRNRSSGICTARNIFQQLGHDIIFNGRPIIDDYYVSNPNHNDKYHIHTNHDDIASGMETDDTKDEEMSSTSQTPHYMGSTLANSHYTQGSSHARHPSHSHNYHGHHKSTTNVTNLLSAKEYFLQTLYQSAAEYNIAIQKSRKNSFFDIHTKINQVAQRIDMVEPSLEKKKDNLSNNSIPTKKDFNLHFYSDDYSATYHPVNDKSNKGQWEIVLKEDYTQYPFALMDGQYQGLYSIYPRFKPNDDIQNLEEEYISSNTVNKIIEIKPNVPEFIGNVHGDYIANPYFQKFRMSPSPPVSRGRHGHRFRSHHDSLNDTSSIASTPTIKSVTLEDMKRKRRGRPARRGRPKRESYETYYDNEEENDGYESSKLKQEDDTMIMDQKKTSNNEDEIVDVVNDDDDHEIISPLNEDVCVHCQSVDPPEQLHDKIDPSIQPRNMVIKCSVCHRNQHPCCCDIYDPYMIAKILRLE
jgi:hypothetical protein